MNTAENMTQDQLRALAHQVEAHLSPEMRAQMLQADLALSNALHELVDVERAKANQSFIKEAISGMVKAEPGAKFRATLYPDKVPRPGRDPALSGSLAFAGRTLALRAWIGPNQGFINIELSVL